MDLADNGGIYVNSNSQYAWTFQDSPQWTAFYYTGTTPIPVVPGQRVNIVLDSVSSSVSLASNGAIYPGVMTGTRTKTAQKELRLFSNVSGNANFGKFKLYGFKIYEADVLKHDYRPMKSGGRGVLKDAVTGRVIRSATSTELSFGGKIKEEPYIESRGFQCVPVDYVPNAKSVVEIGYQVLEKAASTTIFGSSKFRLMQNASLNQEFQCHSAYSGGLAGQADLKRHSAIIDNPNSKVYYRTAGVNTATINMKEKSGYTAEEPNDAQMAVLGCGSNTVVPAKVRVYYVNVFEDGVLLHNYEPYVKAGVAGFRDEVGGGGFFTPIVKKDSADSAAGLSWGGEMSNDGLVPNAYIESDKTQYIPTGYKPTPKTKIELDFQLKAKSNEYYLMGCEANPYWRIYCNYSLKYGFLGHSPNSSSTTQTADVDLERHVVTVDGKARTVSLTTGGQTTSYNLSAGSSADSDLQLGLFARQEKSGDQYGYTPMRVYLDWRLSSAEGTGPFLRGGVEKCKCR